MLSQILGCVKPWLVSWGVCAGECWGKEGEKHMASNHLFAFLILKNSKGCKLRAPPRASLNCIQLQWPLMGIVHHSGQQYQHRSKPQLQNAWAVGWIMAIPSGSRYYYFSKHMAECCVIKKKNVKREYYERAILVNPARWCRMTN